MKLKVFLQHSSARKTNRYTPYKEWVIPRLDYWTARVRNNAPVPKYDTTLEKWVFEPLGDTDKTNGVIKRPLIVPKQRIRSSPLKEKLGLRLQSENQATKSYTAAEGPSCPRLSEYESDSECQTNGELDPSGYFADEFEKALKNRGESDGRFEPVDSEIRHELEGNLTDGDERTAASSVDGEDRPWWCPSPDALDFLFTHSSPDEFGRKYRTWSELETSEGQNSPNTSRGDSYIPTDQSLWYAKNVLATGRDIIYRPMVEDWREQMDEWSHMTRLINECEAQSLIPTLQFPTHTCEWLARVDFRHESVRQKIDYTRPRPKSLREKPGFCARHRPYVRKTRNHREALAKAGRMDLNRVQFIDNY
ncbi:uncharacterized protein LOC111132363 isoform X2 [Crassostrea virginica]